MTTTPTKPKQRPARVPLLLGMSEIRALFEGQPGATSWQTIYRWRQQKGGLGAPRLVVSGTAMWTLDQIETFAARKGFTIDPAVIETYRLAQNGTSLR